MAGGKRKRPSGLQGTANTLVTLMVGGRAGGYRDSPLCRGATDGDCSFALFFPSTHLFPSPQRHEFLFFFCAASSYESEHDDETLFSSFSHPFLRGRNFRRPPEDNENNGKAPPSPPLRASSRLGVMSPQQAFPSSSPASAGVEKGHGKTAAREERERHRRERAERRKRASAAAAAGSAGAAGNDDGGPTANGSKGKLRYQ